MTSAELLAYCKLSKRVTSDSFNTEFNNLIEEAITDIEESTGTDFDLDNPMMCSAVVMYVHSHFGDGNTIAEERYQRQLSKLSTQTMGDATC